MKLTVSQKKTTPISKDLIGVFFEDINYGADGGIYGVTFFHIFYTWYVQTVTLNL